MAAKKKETIEIPINLATLLLAEPSDYKDPKMYEKNQEIAKALLAVLVANN